MAQFDTILHPDFVVPIVPRYEVLPAHSVGIKGDTISAVLPRAEALELEASEHVDLAGCVLMPGLINSHCHAAMSLLRGYADDLPLMTWLQRYIWPTERQFISSEFVLAGSELAIADLILGGTTTLVDHYFFPEVTAEACERAGLRALLTFPVIDVTTAWARDTEECISRGLALRDRYRNHDHIEIGFGPHSTYQVSEETLARVAVLAEELDAPIQIHLHETDDEVLSVVEQSGMRPVDLLEKLGVLGPRTQCVHMTALGEQDMDTIATHGAHVVHCPRSNLKLGTGVCAVQKLLDRGINVALGTDGAASNNRLNMISELQTAALIGKTAHGDPKAVDAWTTLEMATLSGARALGRAADLGSVEIGKLADLIALDLSGVQHLPLYDLASSLVYGTSGSEVKWSWVAGRCVLRDGQLQSVDYTEVTERASDWSDQLAAFRTTLEQ
ncbi:MAG: TRZ/ATZ family hydrolase [Luminiphilus sp.]|nr:TRZ/ATZ family hydrolase [Luminiphilus sp.]